MNPHTLIDVSTLQAHLQHEDWCILDCRFNLTDTEAGRRAYQQGHIPGARYAHLDQDLSGPLTPGSGRHPLPQPSDFLHRVQQWGIRADTQVVAYDDMGGAMAARLWWLLKSLGHAKVAVLNGGWQAWLTASAAQQQEIPPCVQSDFQPQAALLGQRSLAEVLAQLKEQRWMLVDARAPERFRGEVEPLDPVAGHIPGALNRPLQLNLQADGRFKSVDQLRAEWQQLLGERSPKEVVHYCGSGVTACHNLLAMEHAGLSGSRLYPGSWSEWCQDPGRPVATG
ncbi:sulfurtransferase [Balneatrix alpica]|uniref:Sulfurtransferase n=1 Tax=Balneatrix alpica TaxID=75684 RepID=A0ABV5ZEG9_9GAMM|nr:sulfurtransferase [Balneatrix alpica]